MATRARQVYIVPHTHWDREWYEPFQTFRLKLVDLLDELLAQIESDPAYAHFMLDGQMAAVDDYLEVRPDQERRIRSHVASGRIGIGPWQILMDEFLVSGETIVRNLQAGMARAAAMGGPMEVGYLPDMFGHIAQMPQILRQFGLSDAVVWRGVPRAIDRSSFDWASPDGSTVRAEFLPDGYWNGQKTPTEATGLLDRIRRFETRWGDVLHGPILWMNGMDHEMPQPWLGRVVAEANASQRDYFLRVASLPEYLAAAEAADQDGPPRPRWTGELRSGARANLLMGVASNRVDVHQAAALAERWIERVAEPASALARPTGEWPAELLDVAWRELIRNSAHDSSCACSADEVCEAVLVRYAEARHIGEGLARRAVDALAATLAEPGEILVNTAPTARPGLLETRLWGTDPWTGTQFLGPRGGRKESDPVRLDSLVELVMGALDAAPVLDDADLVDVAGEPLRCVLRPGEASPGGLSGPGLLAAVADLARADGTGRVGTLTVEMPVAQKVLAWVPEVPGFGWARWEPGELPEETVSASVADDGSVLVGGPLVSVVVDPDTATFSLDGNAGMGRLVDDGDVGDTYNWCPPTEQVVVDRPVPGSTKVEVVESGPLRARVVLRADYDLPEEAELPIRRVGSVTTTVTTTIELRAGSRLVWVTHELDNRSRDHRLRAHFPLPQATDTATAECAFGLVTRGRDAEGGPTETPTPTRPMRRFVCAGGLTLIQEGLLEYELVGDDLALTLLRCTGAISRGPMTTRALPAGPTTETPAAQLPGRRVLRYALASGDDTRTAFALADEAFTPLLTARAAGGGEAETIGSLLSVEGAQVSSVTRVDGNLTVRVFNPTDEEVTVQLGDRNGWLTDLRGRPSDTFEGSFRLRPWGIATAVLA